MSTNGLSFRMLTNDIYNMNDTEKNDLGVEECQRRLPRFVYDFQSGPVENIEDIQGSIAKGNCRLAVQIYQYLVHGIWLEPKKVFCPELYLSTGVFVQREGAIDPTSFQEGNIILAERIRNKDGRLIDKSRSFFSTEEEWIISLHSALVKTARSKKDEIVIWHATAIAGGTCEWTWNEFEYYYRAVAVKRVDRVNDILNPPNTNE